MIFRTRAENGASSELIPRQIVNKYLEVWPGTISAKIPLEQRWNELDKNIHVDCCSYAAVQPWLI